MRIGFCSALGLSTADLLRAESTSQGSAPAKSVIHVYLGGGFASQESFDPKPEAAAIYRGPFGVVKTKTGEVFSDRFPQMAAVADKFTVVRSCHCRIPDHGQANYHLHTGYLPTTVIDYPSMGSVVSHELGPIPDRDLPAFVGIPTSNTYSGTGYLGAKFGAFNLGASPSQNGDFKPRDMTLPNGLSEEHFQRRGKMRGIIEQNLRSMEGDLANLDSMDELYRQANVLLGRPESRDAFSLENETDATKQLYGLGKRWSDQQLLLGGKLLLARRLVEAGVRFVSVEAGNWDDHIGIQQSFDTKGPEVDHALAGFFTDMDSRGLLDDTLVLVTTEFGRTPKINRDNGRDHWARSYSMLMSGGGIVRGQVYGASDATASEPERDPVALEDFLHTAYHQIGIDANKELMAFGNRPIEIVNGGKLVKGLLA